MTIKKKVFRLLALEFVSHLALLLTSPTFLMNTKKFQHFSIKRFSLLNWSSNEVLTLHLVKLINAAQVVVVVVVLEKVIAIHRQVTRL